MKAPRFSLHRLFVATALMTILVRKERLSHASSVQERGGGGGLEDLMQTQNLVWEGAPIDLNDEPLDSDEEVSSSEDEPTQIGPINLTVQPRPIQLELSLRKVKDFGVRLKIVNPYPDKSAYILKWNTVLEDFKASPNAKTVLHILHTDGGRDPQPRGHGIHVLYEKANPSHFIRIGPGKTFSKVIDLYSRFFIAETREYLVIYQEQFRAFLLDRPFLDTDSIARSDVSRLPTITFDMRKYMELGATPGPSRIRSEPRMIEEHAAISCSSLELKALELARTGANHLADVAKVSRNDEIWKLYNNGEEQVRQKVNDVVYNNVWNYRQTQTQTFGIREECGNAGRVRLCSQLEHAVAFHQDDEYSDTTSRVVFCDRFFSLQPLLQCYAPGRKNPQMMDQSGVFLHELTHSRQVAQRGYDNPIHDGTFNQSWITGMTQTG
ncbi:MAG: hypothetical protein M1836_003094 [Candelina mexicana]|nr:MAG: hypothetical protein M1836_003094 [Candelina mexicana]